MKKILTLLAVTALLSSCSKDYSCKCTMTDLDPNDNFAAGGVETIPLGKQKKKDAENLCDFYNVTTAEYKDECVLETN